MSYEIPIQWKSVMAVRKHELDLHVLTTKDVSNRLLSNKTGYRI